MPAQRLYDYPALVEWSQAAGALARGTAARLRALAAGAPGHLALRRARELRETIARLALGAAPARYLAVLNRELAIASATPTRVSSRPGGVRWTWEPDTPAGVLAPVALSAAELLSSPLTLEKTRVCESDDGCGWLFVDETRTGTRRWCDMRTCGNRAKAHRHYERARKEKL